MGVARGRQAELEAEVARREAVEVARRASEERFRLLTESVPQLVWTCRADGWCDYLSRQWVEYTGVPEADHLGAAWVAVVHPDDRDRLAARWAEAVATGGDFDVEFRVRRHDGAYRWFKTRARPIRGADRAVAQWVGTNTDIDDQKRQEETLDRLVRDRTAALESRTSSATP